MNKCFNCKFNDRAFTGEGMGFCCNTEIKIKSNKLSYNSSLYWIRCVDIKNYHCLYRQEVSFFKNILNYFSLNKG